MRCRTASWPWPRWTRTLDHVRGSPVGRVILEYGDYQYPYSRQAFHAIELAGQLLGGNVRFAFPHFPLIGIHPHALAAAAAAEAAARQGRFWDCTSCCSAGERRSKTATCAGTPSNSGWMWPRSTTTRPARRCWRGSAATWTAVGRRPGAGGAHSVRRRRPAPRRLRSAHPAGRSRRDGLMTLPAHGRRILPMLATIGPPRVACLGVAERPGEGGTACAKCLIRWAAAPAETPLLCAWRGGRGGPGWRARPSWRIPLLRYTRRAGRPISAVSRYGAMTLTARICVPVQTPGIVDHRVHVPRAGSPGRRRRESPRRWTSPRRLRRYRGPPDRPAR